MQEALTKATQTCWHGSYSLLLRDNHVAIRHLQRGPSRAVTLRKEINSIYNQPSRFNAWRLVVSPAHYSLSAPACSCVSIILHALSVVLDHRNDIPLFLDTW